MAARRTKPARKTLQPQWHLRQSATLIASLGWSGIVVVMPILYFFTFIFLNGVFGDARESPWGLVLVAYAAFAAPGLLLPVHPQLWGHYVPLILVVMWITRYVAPQAAVLFGFRKIQAKIVQPGQELVPTAREVRNEL